MDKTIMYKIAYVVSDLKRVGPSNQTLNIIKNLPMKDECIVITLFAEPNDSMIQEYIDNNVKVISLNLNRITFTLNGSKLLKKILKEFKIKIVHSYGVKPDYICQKATQKTNVIHIITLRNYPKEDILTRMNFVKGKIALHSHLKTLLKCENVICCSKTIYNKMSKDYPYKKFSYIQNGVDVERFKKINNQDKLELRKKYNMDINKRIFISTGSFIPRKRIEETIKGFIESKSNEVLLLLGDGFLFKELKQKYESTNNIIFYGKSSNVEELLQLSDFFISSSESEGLPNGVIEAIASGLPVILSDIPQHKEILEELPEAGICYRLGNVIELAKIINSNKELLSNVNINDSPFNMTNMSNKYANYYAKVGKGKI